MNSVSPFILQRFSPCVCTVGNNPDAFSFVWRSDTASWNNNRLDGISFGFEICTDFVECESAFFSIYVILFEKIVCASHLSDLAGLHHRLDSSNVFTNDPSGVYLPYRSKHLWPEVAVIVRSLSSTSEGEGLAWESSGENIDLSVPLMEVCFGNVFITF